MILLCFAALSASPAARAQDQSAREFTECADNCPVMVAIPAGKFTMGSPASEAGRYDNEGPQHYVSVRAFAIGKYDVTSEQFRQFLRETSYQPKPCDPRLGLGWRSLGHGLVYPPSEVEPLKWPAVCLDWRDTEAYVGWLNKRVRDEHPSIVGRSGPYRLPTEAEWEYAARAGTTTSRWWGNDVGNGQANCNGCGSRADNQELVEVDQTKANAWGLYGVLGNAWQWTADCWHKSYVGAPSNGHAWIEPNCTKHVLRGGSWDNVPIFIRSAARAGGLADGGEYDYSTLAGFRVARDLP